MSFNYRFRHSEVILLNERPLEAGMLLPTCPFPNYFLRGPLTCTCEQRVAVPPQWIRQMRDFTLPHVGKNCIEHALVNFNFRPKSGQQIRIPQDVTGHGLAFSQFYEWIKRMRPFSE